jgi:hypothetical protein
MPHKVSKESTAIIIRALCPRIKIKDSFKTTAAEAAQSFKRINRNNNSGPVPED